MRETLDLAKEEWRHVNEATASASGSTAAAALGFRIVGHDWLGRRVRLVDEKDGKVSDGTLVGFQTAPADKDIMAGVLRDIVNFIVYYAIDDDKSQHNLELQFYGGGPTAAFGNWVLLEPAPSASGSLAEGMAAPSQAKPEEAPQQAP